MNLISNRGGGGVGVANKEFCWCLTYDGPVYMIQAEQDAYRDPARNTNSKEYLYDPVTYPA
jgi:hypothetical protein